MVYGPSWPSIEPTRGSWQLDALAWAWIQVNRAHADGLHVGLVAVNQVPPRGLRLDPTQGSDWWIVVQSLMQAFNGHTKWSDLVDSKRFDPQSVIRAEAYGIPPDSAAP